MSALGRLWLVFIPRNAHRGFIFTNINISELGIRISRFLHENDFVFLSKVTSRVTRETIVQAVECIGEPV